MNYLKKGFNYHLKLFIFLGLFVGVTGLLNYTLTSVKAGENHNHHNMNSSDNSHDHKTLDVSNLAKIPAIKIEVFPDKVKGWNLYLNTSNFEFISPMMESSNANQGHGHLYINGEKVGRIYGNWFYLSELPKGDNEIKVTLNTNSHQDLMYNGKVVGDRILIKNKK